MTAPRETETGFRLLALYCPSLRLEVVDADAASEPFGDDQVRLGWDWAWLEPNRLFEVMVSLDRSATPTRPEVVHVRVIGRFEIGSAATTVQVEEFAYKNATALLVPYARQAFSQLTMQGPFGAHLIPPINVAAAIQRFDPRLATAAKQVSEPTRRGLIGG